MDTAYWRWIVGAAPVANAAQMSGRDVWLLVLLVAALSLAALSAAAETALTSVNRIKLRNLAEDGDPRAKRILKLLQSPQTFLSSILVASNVSVIVASTVATILAIDFFPNYGEVLSTVVLSLIVLIFCEITPKTAAVQAPETWARSLVGPIEAISTLLHWPIIGLTFITNGIVRLLGGQTVRRGPFVTEEELRLMVEVGEEEGVLEEEERDMIHNVFELSDTSVREVMVPRVDMVTVDADATIEEAMALIVQGGQSRIPVFDDASEDIIGVLYAKDLLRMTVMGQHPSTVRSLVRPAYYVPETKRLDDLLRELQLQRVHMAIVLDEYGGVAGLVTIEDLVEEIIGDIQDEYDKEEQIFERVGDNEFLVDAKISLDELNEHIDTELTSEDYETLGGFIYAQLDKIPTTGDSVHYENLTITVVATKGRRVTKVRIVRTAPGASTPTISEVHDERDADPLALQPPATHAPPPDGAPGTLATSGTHDTAAHDSPKSDGTGESGTASAYMASEPGAHYSEPFAFSDGAATHAHDGSTPGHSHPEMARPPRAQGMARRSHGHRAAPSRRR